MVDSLQHCQTHKGLEIFGWVLMTNHIHLIARTKEGHSMSDFLRDFKKFTSKKISKEVQNDFESRRDWILHRFRFHVAFEAERDFKVWQDGSEAKEIVSNDFFDQKLDYIHMNPVKAEIVREPKDYLHSSAIDYAGGKGLLEITFP